MRRLIIVGAGGLGREVFSWASHHPDCGKAWSIAGFIDDNLTALDNYSYPVKVINSISNYIPGAEDVLVCAIGDPAIKRIVCERLIAHSAEFISLIHPTVVMGSNVSLDSGVVICPNVTLTADIQVGTFSLINCHSSAGHDVDIGAWSTISGHCDLTGGCKIGEGAFLATGVRLLPGKTVGSNAFVGAASVVVRSVQPEDRVFGNPARSIM